MGPSLEIRTYERDGTPDEIIADLDRLLKIGRRRDKLRAGFRAGVVPAMLGVSSLLGGLAHLGFLGPTLLFSGMISASAWYFFSLVMAHRWTMDLTAAQLCRSMLRAPWLRRDSAVSVELGLPKPVHPGSKTPAAARGGPVWLRLEGELTNGDRFVYTRTQMIDDRARRAGPEPATVRADQWHLEDTQKIHFTNARPHLPGGIAVARQRLLRPETSALLELFADQDHLRARVAWAFGASTWDTTVGALKTFEGLLAISGVEI